MKEYFKTFIDFIKKYYIFILAFAAYILITYLLKIPNCPVKLLCGYPCPGCGMTRAGFSIFQLDFKEALNYNPLIYLLPFVLIIIIFKEKSFFKKIYKSNIFWISLLVLVLGIYVYRMIEVYPEYPMNYDSRNIIEFFKNLFE